MGLNQLVYPSTGNTVVWEDPGLGVMMLISSSGMEHPPWMDGCPFACNLVCQPIQNVAWAQSLVQEYPRFLLAEEPCMLHKSLKAFFLANQTSRVWCGSCKGSCKDQGSRPTSARYVGIHYFMVKRGVEVGSLSHQNGLGAQHGLNVSQISILVAH